MQVLRVIADIGVTWLVTPGRQSQPWLAGTSICYKYGKDSFELVRNIQ